MILKKSCHALIKSRNQFFSPNTLEEIYSFGMYVCERTFNIFTAAEICLVCSQFCKFDGTLGKLERVYEEDRVWEWYHAINKLILFCIYTAEASLRINMWPSRLLMAHIQYTEKRSIFFHLNVELENRETERENYKKRLLFILNHSVKNPYHHFLSLTRWQLPLIGLRIQENTAITAAWILPLAEFS